MIDYTKNETVEEAVKRIQENGSSGILILNENGRVSVVADQYKLVPMED
jgi:CBS domain-containing protein